VIVKDLPLYKGVVSYVHHGVAQISELCGSEIESFNIYPKEKRTDRDLLPQLR
jgi:hypothetical protein